MHDFLRPKRPSRFVRFFRDIYFQWRLRTAGAFFGALWRNPALTMQLIRGMKMRRRWWQSFSLQIHGADFLRDFYEVCDACGARPMLFWGTLLGYVREGSFIPHDYDIDLVLQPEDRPKQDALVAGMLARGYRLRHNHKFQFSFFRRDYFLYLDVDILFVSNGRLAVISPLTATTGEIDAFPADAIGEPRQGLFVGAVKVWLPQNPELVLSSLYGDWRTPRPDYAGASDGPHRPIEALERWQ